jgi:endonuclease/exonuclease/phosphatase family metal-dependent hydrolase
MKTATYNTFFMRLRLFIFLIIPFASVHAQTPTNVKIFTLNMWENGTHVTSGLSKIANAIIAANADIVVLTELKSPQGTFLTNLKNQIVTNGGPSTYNSSFVSASGSPAQGDVGILSKYPIKLSPDPNPPIKVPGGISVFTVTIATQNVKIAAAHLDYVQYALYLPRGYKGVPDWSMIDVSPNDNNPDPQTDVTTILDYNLASQKDEAINPFITWANAQTDPIILAGDFNDASHLDWTDDTKNMFDHNGVIAEWQNTKALEMAGFKDSYRQAFPNEVTHPGITWPAVATGVATTSYTPKSDERDRIDFIFYKGAGISTVSSTLVGPNRSWVRNVNTVETGSDPYIGNALSWPSDHKGVMSELRLFGSVLPVKISAFTASALNGKGNLLGWEVSQEVNVKLYEIERSADGTRFEKIGTVAQSGLPKYNFTDVLPHSGENYYRLKIVDEDGRFEYSAIVRTKNIKPIAFNLQSTTIQNGSVKFNLTGLKAKTDADIVITGLSGRMVKSFKLSGITNDTWYTTSLGSDKAGVYLINISLSSGEKFSKKVIIN